MQQDNQREKSFNEEKKKTRRTRKDEQGRNFTCPCGKSYLSYPALYTHTKTKHQGKPPKQDAASVTMKVQVEEQAEKKEPLQQIKEILDKYFVNQTPESYLNPMNREDSQYIKSIIDDWDLVKESKVQDPSGNPNESINNIFARFLTVNKPEVKGEGYAFLCHFICFFKNYLAEATQNGQFCKISNGSMLPTYFSNLVTVKKNVKGSPLSNSLLLSKIIYNFGIWMYQQRYTSLIAKFSIL